MKFITTTIIPNPTWGKTLELLQEKGSIRINTTSSKAFKNLLDSINLKYSVNDDTETKLSRFTLNKSKD
jgi:hypothetical protein